MKLKAHVVYRIDYACDTPGPETEYGSVVGFWTGAIDTWGKLTIVQVPSGPPYYLFAREIVDAERIADEAMSPELFFHDCTDTAAPCPYQEPAIAEFECERGWYYLFRGTIPAGPFEDPEEAREHAGLMERQA